MEEYHHWWRMVIMMCYRRLDICSHWLKVPQVWMSGFGDGMSKIWLPAGGVYLKYESKTAFGRFCSHIWISHCLQKNEAEINHFFFSMLNVAANNLELSSPVKKMIENFQWMINLATRHHQREDDRSRIALKIGIDISIHIEIFSYNQCAK